MRYVNNAKHNFVALKKERILFMTRDRMQSIITKKYMAEIVHELAEDLQRKADSEYYTYESYEKEVVNEETGEVITKTDWKKVKLDTLTDEQNLKLAAIDKVMAKLAEMI